MLLKGFVLKGAAICAIIHSNAARASETVAYIYDAQGRMIEANHSATGPNANLDIQYQYDLAGNRTVHAVTGSSNTGQQVIVTPMGGSFDITPINP